VGGNNDDKDCEAEMEAQCALTQQDKNVGDHMCPVHDAAVATDFATKNMWDEMLKDTASKDFLLDVFDLCEDDLLANPDLVCAVSKPGSLDCPLVYVSKGFEKVTGYTREFALGRSCRFLQPTVRIVNDAMNLLDLKRMREFCNDPHTHPAGTEIVNLLLNERYEGPRFWNLLKMAYVDLAGETYIFAVQTPLGAYMPKVLRGRITDPAKNDTIVKSCSQFSKKLNALRNALVERKGESIFELAACATDYLDRLALTKVEKKAMITVHSVAAISRCAKASGSRKILQGAVGGGERLSLRLKHVAEMKGPAPNKFIALNAGQSTSVSEASQSNVFSIMSSENLKSLAGLRITIDVVPRHDSEPYAMVTVQSSGNKGEVAVLIEGEEVAPGSMKAMQLGDDIAFGDIVTFRLGTLKRKACK
jgi:hypothetical protein